MRRTGAAESEEDEVARIVALLDRHLANDVRHVQLDDAAGARRAFNCRHADLLSQFFYCLKGGVAIQAHAPAGEIVRVEVAEHELRVGHGRHRAAAAVAHRSRERARAVGADGHRARLRLHAHQAAAAGADRLQVDFRQEIFVLVGVRDEGVGGLAAVDDRDVERRAAHVRGDDVLLPHRVAEEHGRRHARYRA